MFKKYFLALPTVLCAALVCAQVKDKLVDPRQVIKNLDASLTALAQKTHLPVIFPKEIPQPSKSQRYYLYTEVQPNVNRYTISIDSTADCHGAHYCNLGSLTASQGDNPQIYYSMDRQELTIPVPLAIKKIGYFTPGHPMASYWSPQLEWREKDVLYSLRWNLSKQSEKSTLVAMVNSVGNLR